MLLEKTVWCMLFARAECAECARFWKTNEMCWCCGTGARPERRVMPGCVLASVG
jgi:hypothetical protein